MADLERFVVDDGLKNADTGGTAEIQLETIRAKAGISLLMAVQPGLPVTVNGLPAALISVLHSGDVIGVGEHVLHVSLLSRPYVGPPDAGHVGVLCGYCRVEIKDEPNMQVYVCPNCQQPTHNQGEEVPTDARLECAQLSPRCGHCDAEIVTTEAFNHVPEF